MGLTAKRTGHLTYTVMSETDETKVYVVNMELKSCSCPHHQYRQAFCKHLEAAHWAEKARDIKDDEIAGLFFKYEAKEPQIAAAIQAEILRRQSILEAQEELKRLFA